VEGVCLTVDSLINDTINANVRSFFVHTDITGSSNDGTCTVNTTRGENLHNVLKLDTGIQVRTFKQAITALLSEC